MSKDKKVKKLNGTVIFTSLGCLNFMNCIVFFCPYSMSTENTFMTGVRLALSTEHHRIASGAAAVWKMKPVIRVML